MFKKLLSFFKIIDEVQVPASIKREAVHTPVKKEAKILFETEVHSEMIPEQRKIERKEFKVQVPVSIQHEADYKSLKEEVEIFPEAEVHSEIIPKQRKIERKRKEIKDFDEHTRGYKKYCLEKTSNQHIMKTSSYKVIDRNDSTETFLIEEDAFITHAEHRMLRIESPYFVKYIQQEYNPITKMNENAYD